MRQQRAFCQQPASLALSEGINASKVLFVALFGTVGLIPAVRTWLERGWHQFPDRSKLNRDGKKRRSEVIPHEKHVAAWGDVENQPIPLSSCDLNNPGR